MRHSFRYLIIAFFLFLWVAAPVWSPARDESDPGNAGARFRVVLAQETQEADDTPEPTRAPRPTPTPIPVPPPTSQNTIQLLVVSGVLLVAVIIFGLWLNRNRLF